MENSREANVDMALELYRTEIAELNLQIAQAEADLAATRAAEASITTARQGQEATLARITERRDKLQAALERDRADWQ